MNDNVLIGAAVYGGVVVVVFWLAMVVWAYRDMRARSRDGLASALVAVLVLVLNVPGLFVYILMRPRETLAEAYERSLEEEALLQEIEEKPSCPGCGTRVQLNWQACPVCHTRLKKTCVNCRNLLDLSWTLCPICATPQPQHTPGDQVINSSRHIARQAPPPPAIPEKWLASQQDKPSAGGKEPRYVDDV
ncbi:zinc ribbon domain-containing protein [Aggregatilineales bacterium SYSU G02658]